MDNQDIVKKEDAFEAGEYLSSAQIEIVKGRKDGPLSDQGSLLSLIDGFVRSNGKADAKYEALFKIAKNAGDLMARLAEYPQPVQQTLPVLLGVSFWDLLMLVGVIDEKEVEDLKAKAMASMGVGNAPDWSNKA